MFEDLSLRYIYATCCGDIFSILRTMGNDRMQDCVRSDDSLTT